MQVSCKFGGEEVPLMADRTRTRSGGLSSAAQSVVCALIVVPLAEAAVWAALRAVGGETGATVLVGVGSGTFCGVYALGPSRWLADPGIAGWFGRDHPLASRIICGFGAAFGFGLAAVGLFKS